MPNLTSFYNFKTTSDTIAKEEIKMKCLESGDEPKEPKSINNKFSFWKMGKK